MRGYKANVTKKKVPKKKGGECEPVRETANNPCNQAGIRH